MLSKEEIRDDYYELINAIRHTDANDVKALSVESDMSWPTVNQKIRTLIDEGYVLFSEQGDRKYSINAKLGCFLGVSIGVLDTKICILDFSFKHIEFVNSCNENVKLFVKSVKEELVKYGLREIETNSYDFLKFTRCTDYSCIYRVCTAILDFAVKFLDSSDFKLLSVGVSLPGIVDKDSGVVEFSPNFMSLVGLKISNIIGNSVQEEMTKRDIFFHIYHDTLAATTYEKEFLYLNNSQNKHKKNIVTMYLEYGLGCSYIIQNRLLDTATGEYGHINITFNEDEVDSIRTTKTISDNSKYNDVANMPMCACGNRTCLERLIRVHGFDSIEIDDYIDKIHDLTQYSADQPYRYNKLKHLLSIAVNTTVNLLAPDLFVLSGEILTSIPKLRDDLEFNMYSSALKSSSKYCSIINGTSQNDVTAAGAAVLSYYHKYSMNDELNVCWK